MRRLTWAGLSFFYCNHRSRPGSGPVISVRLLLSPKHALTPWLLLCPQLHLPTAGAVLSFITKTGESSQGSRGRQRPEVSKHNVTLGEEVQSKTGNSADALLEATGDSETGTRWVQTCLVSVWSCSWRSECLRPSHRYISTYIYNLWQRLAHSDVASVHDLG